MSRADRSIRPTVGITASRRGALIMWWLNALAAWRGGGRPVRLNPGRDLPFDRLDALVVGGGDDIDAELYGRELALDVRVDPERDRLELAALEHAHRVGLPMLGICRGSQMINVSRGGTLHTDIYEVYEKAPRLRTVLPRKVVRTRRGSRLHAILEQETCWVNSLHHQSVDAVGDGLEVVCEDAQGVVQGVEDPRHPFLVGVQWHPEFLITQRSQQRLFRKLVAAARERG